MPSRKVGLAQRLHDQVKTALLGDEAFAEAVKSSDADVAGEKAVSLILVRDAHCGYSAGAARSSRCRRRKHVMLLHFCAGRRSCTTIVYGVSVCVPARAQQRAVRVVRPQVVNLALTKARALPHHTAPRRAEEAVQHPAALPQASCLPSKHIQHHVDKCV